ncbi:MAG: hypothetical protein IKJ06_03640 [Clostridia bacterium]|nr:hypothetical protein [Clostridia bacterium]
MTDILALEQYTLNDLLFLGIVFTAIIGITMLIVFITNIIIPFKAQRDYIKMEINRTRGHERDYWKKELTRLYIRYIPIIGAFVSKHR